MTKRWIFMGITVVAVLALTAGIAFAAGRGGGTRPSTATTVRTQMVAACDAMHDSAAMQKLHAQMPAAAQAQWAARG